MKTIIDILMKRDDMSFEDAKELVMDVMREVQDCISCGDYELAIEIFESDLGLEPDYLMNVLI